MVFDPGLGCSVLGTTHVRIHFEVLDPDLGSLVLDTPNLQINFEVWDPDYIPRKCCKHIDFYTVWEQPGTTGFSGFTG